MVINELLVNHWKEPIGYELGNPVFSWKVRESSGSFQKWARLRIFEDMDRKNPFYDSGEQREVSSVAFCPKISLKPKKRYYWNVEVEADDGDHGVSELSWFETGKMDTPWEGKWITTVSKGEINPVFYKKYKIYGKIKEARAYVTGLGLFEFYVNWEKQGNEYLAPFFMNYDQGVQYLTFDITSALVEGENIIAILLGNGWYKGRFSCQKHVDCIYGNRFCALMELHIWYEDGREEVLGSNENYLYCEAPIKKDNLYDGEIWDGRLEEKVFQNIQNNTGEKAVLLEESKNILERLSLPLVILERRKPERLILTPKGEQVLDFGQEITGWVEFDCSLPKGKEVLLQYGEILQEGNFYNENLRSAKAEFHYISSGKKRHVRPHFTFFGFRYVKVSGIKVTDLLKFEGCVLCSDTPEIGFIETSNSKINRLIQNTKWGQKGNFLDIPTDCPQRDEKLGWTGDAQIFCETACLHRYTPAFYRKYIRDMKIEQAYLNGAVPHVVPDVLRKIQQEKGEMAGEITFGACGWGDAACVIPFTIYQYFGDKNLLEEQYPVMKAWVDYLYREDEKRGGSRLRLWGFHFGDWLALDNEDKTSSFGGTDAYFIASAYYYYSVSLLTKAARILEKQEEAGFYGTLQSEIKHAFLNRYFDNQGNLKLTNQTAYVLVLAFGLAPEKQKRKIAGLLVEKLRQNGGHLDTGFLGTPYLCMVLSENGYSTQAYSLLLNEEYPGWLYEVNMGATTIWERWNSVLPDGKVSDTGMNSLNHYAYGSIAAWMYRWMCGITPLEDSPGCSRIKIQFIPDDRMEWIQANYDSAAGQYQVGWKQEKSGQLQVKITVPFGAEAIFCIPSGYYWTGESGQVTLYKGNYEFLLSKK